MREFKAPVFTPEMHDKYKEIFRVLSDLYPFTIRNKARPLPLSEDAIQRISTDPYLRYSEEDMKDFFKIWTARREYSVAICKHQVYYGDDGSEQGEIPVDIITDRARHLARMVEKLDLSKNAWKPK